MADEQQDEIELAGADIVFDCPHCGKSLAIDYRGAGMMIECVDCKTQVQVPVPDETNAEVEDETVVAAVEPEPPVESSALAAAHSKIERLVESLEEVRSRRTYLEKLRTENIARFDRIGGELTVIQAAMDRIVGLLQDAKSEKETGDEAL